MEKTEVIVVGGGISGIAFAWKAARAGRSVLLLESGTRFGGCLHSHRTADGYWHELGAHTTYNSYGGFPRHRGRQRCHHDDRPARPGAHPIRIPAGQRLRVAEPAGSPASLQLARDRLQRSLRHPARQKRTHHGRVLRRTARARELRAFPQAVPRGGPLPEARTASPPTAPAPSSRNGRGARSSPAATVSRAGCRPCARPRSARPASGWKPGLRSRRVAASAAGFVVTTADGRTFEAPLAAIAAPMEAPPRRCSAAISPGCRRPWRP